MLRMPFPAAAIAIALCLAPAGCNKSSTPSPAPTASPAVSNVSGDYTGTMSDSAGGSGTVNGLLAQNGANAGGVLTDTESSATLTAAISLRLNSPTSTSGAMVIDYPSGTTCTFSVTGTYTNNGASANMSGSYTAITNCAGQSGTFSLNQTCSDTVTAGDRRSMTVPAPC